MELCIAIKGSLGGSSILKDGLLDLGGDLDILWLLGVDVILSLRSPREYDFVLLGSTAAVLVLPAWVML